MAEVICVGVAFLDYIFEAEPPTSPDSKTFATEYRQFGGGMAATASVAVALLGGRAILWSRLGNDPAGRTILEGLAARGVQTDFIRKIDGAQSPVSSVIISEDGSRQAVVFPGRHLDKDPGWLPLGRIEETSAVLVDPRWPEAAELALERARENHVPGILDADIGPVPVPRKLVELSSHAIFSRDGLEQFTRTRDVEDGLRRAKEMTDGVVGVTSGADGFYWLSDSGTEHIPALAVTAIDTLGAGDAFHGAFALAIGEGKDMDMAARFANTVAGLKCARPGGRDAIPSRSEVWSILGNETVVSPPAQAS